LKQGKDNIKKYNEIGEEQYLKIKKEKTIFRSF